MMNDKNETYIGIVIGVLSVTVILLISAIVLILRRNRQKIFSKHSSKSARTKFCPKVLCSRLVTNITPKIAIVKKYV